MALSLPHANAHDNIHKSNLDGIEVLQIVSNKRLLYINKHLSKEEIRRTPVYQPKVIYDAESAVWQVSSTRYKTTRKGKCRKTNGCTIVTTLFVTVNDINGKIISKRKEVKRLPNYE